MKSSFSLKSLDEGKFDTVIVAAPDMQGRLFGKRMLPKTFLELVNTGINISSCSLGWDITQTIGMEVDYTGSHTGWHDVRLMPDLNSIKKASWLENTVFVMADVYDNQTGKLLELAPRTILRRQIEALQNIGYKPYIGNELEFFLYSCTYDEARSRSYKNLPPTTWVRSQDSISRETNSLEPFFRNVRSTLAHAGIDLQFSDSEWGYSQWEVNLIFQEELEMADRQTLCKLAIKDLAASAGMAATFMARPTADDVGSSCHMHISLRNSDGDCVFFNKGASRCTSPLMLNSIGGLLHHIPELMIWYAPTVNSYKRTASGLFAGQGKTWGYDNRTVSCRIVGNSPESIRIEFRVPGADVNPYLAIAGVLASIKDGIEKKKTPGEPIAGNAYEHDVKALPDHLLVAANNFASSSFTKAAFGDDVVRHYSAVSQFEWSQFMVAVTEWEKERYFELI